MSYESAIDHAKELIEKERFAQARCVLNELNRRDPSNTEVWFLVSEVAQTKESAIDSLEQVLRIDPGHTIARQRLNTYYEQNPEDSTTEADSETKAEKTDTLPPNLATTDLPMNEAENTSSELIAEADHSHKQENFMFCVHCGKDNAKNASFCAFCGKPISQTIATPAARVDEWEYTFYRRNWERGKGGRWNLTFGRTEYDVRLDNWGSDQDYVMRQLQGYLDKGWQFVNPPGPNSYRFRHHEDYAGSVKFTWLEVSSFIVDFRCPARPRTEKEKQVLGIWQEANDPNHGFWKTLGNVVFSQRLTVDKWRYEFSKDRIFHRTDQDGEKRDGGIFYENDEGEIEMRYKYSPHLDGPVRVTGNKLVIVKSKWEFERVS